VFRHRDNDISIIALAFGMHILESRSNFIGGPGTRFATPLDLITIWNDNQSLAVPVTQMLYIISVKILT